MLRLTSALWFWTTLALSVALVVVILLLSPWSPVSPTGGADSESAIQTGVVTQSGSGPATPSPLATPSARALAPAVGTTGPTPGVKETAPPAASIQVASPAPSNTPLAATASVVTTTAIPQPAEPVRSSPKPTPTPSESPPNPAAVSAPTAESPPEERASPNGALAQVPTETTSDATAPRPLEDLIRATESPEWKTRWDAVNDLGNLKDPKAIPSLAARALYDDNPHPRWRSLWALASVNPGGADVIPFLEAGLDQADPLVVRNAAVALAFFSQPQARPELLLGLHDPDSFRRWEAVFSLRKIADSQVVEALIPLLDGAADPDTRVRGEVALNLGQIGDERVARVLLDALAGDPSSQVRWRCAMSLGRLGDSSVVEEMKRILSSEEDSQTREFIEEAIEKLLP